MKTECKAAPNFINLNFGDISKDEAIDNDIRNFGDVSWYETEGEKIDDYDAEYIKKSYLIELIEEMIENDNIGKYESLTELKEQIASNNQPKLENSYEDFQGKHSAICGCSNCKERESK